MLPLHTPTVLVSDVECNRIEYSLIPILTRNKMPFLQFEQEEDCMGFNFPEGHSTRDEFIYTTSGEGTYDRMSSSLYAESAWVVEGILR